ncbi:hypothetical protein COCNU_scaffold028825G000010 [Cocos nucifera]|nr:hypothetical protein [Cocos nucifera]
MSYARRRAKFVEELERELGEVEFYRMTHTHHDGSFIREESRDMMDRATTLIIEYIGESSSFAEHSHVEAEVFTELI